MGFREIIFATTLMTSLGFAQDVGEGVDPFADEDTFNSPAPGIFPIHLS